MNHDYFYQRVTEIMALAPAERHKQLAQLHTDALNDYLRAISAIDDARAQQDAKIGDEVRTLAQIVGHISEWERFAILACADIMVGIAKPRMMTTFDGFLEPDGASPKFASDTEFNAYQAHKHETWTWEKIYAMAVDSATILHALFTQPNLMSVERLQKTRRSRKRLTNGTLINDTTLGWSLWLTMLDRIAVEHARELEIQ